MPEGHPSPMGDGPFIPWLKPRAEGLSGPQAVTLPVTIPSRTDGTLLPGPGDTHRIRTKSSGVAAGHLGTRREHARR